MNADPRAPAAPRWLMMVGAPTLDAPAAGLPLRLALRRAATAGPEPTPAASTPRSASIEER